MQLNTSDGDDGVNILYSELKERFKDLFTFY